MSKRQNCHRTPSACDRRGYRRSRSHIVPGEPVLKLARSSLELTTADHPEVIETANDTALTTGDRPGPSILYLSAGHSRTPALMDGEVGRSAVPSNSAAPSPTSTPLPPRHSFEPLTRGGAKNRADRRTSALSEEQVRNLMEAVAFAETLGLPLSRFTTIHWAKASVRDGGKATAAFIKALTRLASARGYPVAFVWVRENGPDKGDHVHILWHGPEDWPDLQRCLRRAMKATDAVNRKDVRRTLSVGRSLRAALAGGPDYLANLGAVFSYLVKGADPEALTTLGLDRAEAGGVVVGKRCGVSENIGPEARRRGSATNTRGRATKTQPSANVRFRA
jgi:hypothetical protein